MASTLKIYIACTGKNRKALRVGLVCADKFYPSSRITFTCCSSTNVNILMSAAKDVALFMQEQAIKKYRLTNGRLIQECRKITNSRKLASQKVNCFASALDSELQRRFADN